MIMKKFKKLLKALSINLVVLVILLLFSSLRIYHNLQVLRDVQEIKGSITTTPFDEHGNCGYEFTVGVSKFEGKGYSCNNKNVGDEISIFYSESNPKYSTNIEPFEDFKKGLLGLGFMSLIISAGLIAFSEIYERKNQ